MLGIDINEDYVARHREAGRNVTHGDATDADFWRAPNAAAASNLRYWPSVITSPTWPLRDCCGEQKFDLQPRVGSPLPRPRKWLREAGVNAVFNFYASAGESFAEHVVENFGDMITAEPVQAAQAG